MGTLKAEEKRKKFFCELFEKHEWKEFGKRFERDGITYLRKQCKYCGKRKVEAVPAFIYTPFFSGGLPSKGKK